MDSKRLCRNQISKKTWRKWSVQELLEMQEEFAKSDMLFLEDDEDNQRDLIVNLLKLARNMTI